MSNQTNQPIVCGTDFSTHAAKAADVAAAMALRLKAPLLLIHEVDEYDEAPASLWRDLMAEMRVRLREEAGRVRHSGAKVEEVVAEGAPEDGLTVRGP